MATLKLSVIPNKVAVDGTHKIRVAVCHKTITRYIVTKYKIDDLSQFKNGQVVKRSDASVINRKLRKLLDNYQDKLDSISNIGMYDCKQLREILMSAADVDSASTFQSVANKYVSELIEDGRESYAKLIERNMRYFTEFTRGEFLLADITPMLIVNYERFLRNKKGLSETTIGMNMSRTRTVINRAIRMMVVRYDVHPFIDYTIPASRCREVDLTVENVGRILSCNVTDRRLVVARDLFSLSFYLGGINLIDLLAIDFRNRDAIEYVRTKVRNTKTGDRRTVITIPEEARPIISKWMNRNTGKLDFKYKFSYNNFSRYISRCLADLQRVLNINQKVVYYSARKSFAQFASELGIPESVIDYCLGHSDKSKGVIRFYTRVRQKQAEFAIRKVIDYVKNPESFKDILEFRQQLTFI